MEIKEWTYDEYPSFDEPIEASFRDCTISGDCA